MNPFLIGLALGLFELATDAEGDVKWEAAGYGDLTVEVSPNA